VTEVARDIDKFINNNWYIIVGFVLLLCLIEYWDNKRFERNMKTSFDYVPKSKKPYQRRIENARRNISKTNRHR
jgi:hypothetical protein